MTRKILLTAGAVLSFAVAGQALAGERAADREPTKASLSLTQVDFQNPASVKAFYARLERVAHEVCDSDIDARSIRRADAACARESLDRAVAQLSRPLLTARHQEKSSTAYARGY